ncbi:hypothetical protein A0O34_15170 [Chryseobacterium glaciei]|uniref:Uncharacterized protein n=1 Tax=Chryseobacterium glaciei TaxID=1685010 RepID=A0A172XXT1_9FLAO|nr:hypothetical protein [Chryseobacterium glaciei]ANF51764.1 hypothetical protein A0O34_15170 [Chryseobacterium glaciei]
MLNPVKNTKNRSFSKFLGQRRKSFLPKKEQPQNFDFVKQNQGSISASTISHGIIKCLFSSKATGKTAFAFGPTLGDAYQNMIGKFNLKYS